MSDDVRQNDEKPEEQAFSERVSPISGTAPPREHRFPPGVSGNPEGRKTAGATIREWINSFSNKCLTEKDLRKIARDPSNDWNQRTAAERMLRTLEAPDISNFAGLLRGENTLEDMRVMEINTEVVKKYKQISREVPKGDGNVEVVVQREIEFYDRSGQEFDRVCDQTAGRPVQPVEANVDMKGTAVDPSALAVAAIHAAVKAFHDSDDGK